jgi:hypothetical protein
MDAPQTWTESQFHSLWNIFTHNFSKAACGQYLEYSLPCIISKMVRIWNVDMV